MCVERTAKTKDPSARRSRCSVACQNRAAAGPVMASRWLVLCGMFMVLRVQVCKKGIYPVSGVEFKWRKEKAPRRSGFAGRGHCFIGKRRCLAAAGNHKNHGPEDDRAGKDGAQIERLSTKRPAK